MLESPIIDEALEFMRLRTIRESIRRARNSQCIPVSYTSRG